MQWVTIQEEHAIIRVYAKPNAKQTAMLGLSENGLQIAIHAKPHKGAANIALIAFLAKFFNMPKSQIVLQKGETSKLKVVRLPLTPTVEQFIQHHTK